MTGVWTRLLRCLQSTSSTTTLRGLPWSNLTKMFKVPTFIYLLSNKFSVKVLLVCEIKKYRWQDEEGRNVEINTGYERNPKSRRRWVGQFRIRSLGATPTLPSSHRIMSVRDGERVLWCWSCYLKANTWCAVYVTNVWIPRLV